MRPRENVGNYAGSLGKDSETTPKPDGRLHPTPGNTKPQFWAGLLTRRRPLPAPSRANYIAQWHITGIVRLTAAGGCAGMSVDGDRPGVTGFPFHLGPRLQNKEPKQDADYIPQKP